MSETNKLYFFFAVLSRFLYIIRPVRVLYYEVDVTCLSVRVCLCVCACVCPCQLDEWNAVRQSSTGHWMDGWMGGWVEGWMDNG